MCYPFILSSEEQGVLIEYPDLPGCMPDDDTVLEAIANGEDAVECWIEAAKAAGRWIPKPSKKLPSGRWVQRVPKSLHAKLIEQASIEDVSLNTLVISLVIYKLFKNILSC
jgi:antitoxin HicB